MKGETNKIKLNSRKVRGHDQFIVTIPKNIVLSRGLKKGDLLLFEQELNYIKISKYEEIKSDQP